MDFLNFAHSCGPLVDPITTTAIVKTESDFAPWVIRDNTARTTLNPKDRSEAELVLRQRLAAGHQLAIGLMQVASPWLKKLKLEPTALLDACINITVGTTILADNYHACWQRSHLDDPALVCALSAYWTGNGRTGGVYVNRVFKMAGSRYRVPETPGVTDGLLRARDDVTPVPAFRSFHYRTQTFSFSDPPAATFTFPAGRF